MTTLTGTSAHWVDPEILSDVEWRDGDIVISVPVKSGTTWTMNIVHQLREGGDTDLEDVYAEVPWLEFVPSPTTTRQELLAGFAAMPQSRRRAFKTHTHPPVLPYWAPGSGKDVKYVVVVRHPDEAMASLLPFSAAHSPEWLELWGAEPGHFAHDDFATFFDEVARDRLEHRLFPLLASWWPLRNQPNVLLTHFSDMKRDHEGTIRKIAAFLGFAPSEAQWSTILELTSFPWMKANQQCFEVRTVAPVPVLQPGSMVRRGESGAARNDGVTPAISAAIADIARSVITDPAALHWCYNGGALSE